MELPILFGVRHLSPAGAWHLLRLLEEVRQRLLADKSSGHPKCFSYAATLIPARPSAPLTAYISATDTKMYQYKQKYKVPLSDVVYKDDRI